MSSSTESPATEADQSKQFFREFLRLAGPYWRGPGQLRPRLLTALLGALVLVQVGLSILQNSAHISPDSGVRPRGWTISAATAMQASIERLIA